MTKNERHEKLRELRRTGAVHGRLPAVQLQRTEPCVRRSAEPNGGTVECPSCAGTVSLKLFDCDIHERCTPTKKVAGISCCADCPDYCIAPAPAPPWDRLAPLRLDRENVFPELPGFRFNPSIIADGDGYVFVWRDGWAGSELWAARMDAGFRLHGPARRLELRTPHSDYGREDPQLFRYGGSIYAAFVGVQGARGRVVRTNVLFARLDAGLSVEAIWHPRPEGVPSNRWEKNWGFFEHDGDLYAVYSIAPHRVLRIRGDETVWTHDEPNPLPWAGGERRGGSSPVRAGHEYWSFFHDRVGRAGARVLYRTGLYAFEARPPFRPTRQIMSPIQTAEPSTNPGNYCDCIFPRGAVRVGTDWVVCSGVHDRHSELRAFDHADLDRRLESPR